MIEYVETKSGGGRTLVFEDGVFKEVRLNDSGGWLKVAPRNDVEVIPLLCDGADNISELSKCYWPHLNFGSGCSKNENHEDCR